jgi:hypothetical protein
VPAVFRRGALIGMLVAVFGIAVTPAVSYSTAVAAAKKETRAEKLKKALEACKKDKSKPKRKACERRLQRPSSHPRASHRKENAHEQEEKRLKEAREAREAEETRPGMLVVHVVGSGGQPLENQLMRLSMLGPFGEITTTTESTEHTFKLAPGEYLIEVLAEKGSKGLNETKATVSPAQTEEVTIDVSIA